MKSQKVSKTIGTYSQLELDSDDLAVYVGEYSDKVVELHLDYFGRKTMREFMLFTPEDTILADITNGCVIYECEGRKVELSEDRDTFQQRELRHFLDMIDGKCANDNTVWNAI